MNNSSATTHTNNKRIAVLSNVNMNGVIRLLKKNMDVYNTEGYGNELGILINPTSSIYAYEPHIIFLIEDLMEIISHTLEEDIATTHIKQWFNDIASCIQPNIIYYISDAYLWGQELSILVDKSLKNRIESIWQKELEEFINSNKNIRIFPYRALIEQEGEKNSFSLKMWYMGKILHTPSMQQLINTQIEHTVEIETTPPKKVLLLDLDNTLWGGIAGEDDITPIILSDDHIGLAYKNLQRVILTMQKQGVLLGIVSKNNESDVDKIITNHPHMVLQDTDFAIKKINWNPKTENIKQIALELNLGLDTMVFFDDNPSERQLVKDLLPDVIVPDFPNRIEDLAESMVEIWTKYFDKPLLTEEDKSKTLQYAANLQRESLKQSIGTFEDYLERLEIVLVCKNETTHLDRITQLINKTNQFNLTTKRHSMNEIQEMLTNNEKKIFAYQVIDKFGDNGIIAVVIVNMHKDIPVIEEFVMSCRIMGKNIEDAIIEDIENYLADKGYQQVIGEYKATSKNFPVKDLYPRLGYTYQASHDNVENYLINLKQKKHRNYKLKKIIKERI